MTNEPSAELTRPKETSALRADNETKPIDLHEIDKLRRLSEEDRLRKLAEARKRMTETRLIPRSLVDEAEKQHQERSNTTYSEEKQTHQISKWKLPLYAGALALEAISRAPLVISQLGAIHPWRSNGEWHWVVEPWARINDDPNQPVQGDNAYLDKFGELKKQGVKTLDNTNLPEGELPALRVTTGGLSVQYLNHNRIKAAQANGMRIAVDLYPSNVETLS